MKPYIFLAILMLSGMTLMAQSGDSYFDNEDYYNASRYYEVEVKSNPSKYLKLAKSYFGLKQFEKAAKALETYKKEDANADIFTANKLLALIQRDDDEVELRSVESINTTGDEYSPLISKDGKVLYYVADDHPNGKGGEDIFFSEKQEDGTWGAPKPFTAFNTKSHESIEAISADNNAAILFGNYPGTFGSGDLFYSIKVNDEWTYPCNLGGNINTDDWEAQSNLSSDGRFILFSSTRDGGQGLADIYVAELTDEGWTKPINLGTTINTADQEKTPFLAADGKTLYFSSKGHFGFGSYDLFMSKRLDDSWTSWSEPVNMGKYINTLSDDSFFSIPESGTRAYISGSGSIATNGSYDIYEFIMPPSMRPEALFHVRGTVLDENDSAAAVVIRYFDVEDGKEVAKTVSSREDGTYGVSIPSFRKYDVIIDMKGFLYYATQLDLTDPSQYFEKKTFQQILGEDYAALKESSERMDTYGLRYKNYLGAGTDVDPLDNFENLVGLASMYDKEAEEMDRILRNARYKYLTELENQREITQDHDVTRIKVGAKFEVKNIFFDFGKSTLRSESKAELDKLYDIMSRSEIVVEFGGHSDNVGSDEANQALSQQRVNSVKTYLVDKGINGARIDAVGYGESQPVASNETEEGRQKNRRVELKITSLRLPREGSDDISDDEAYDGIKEDDLFVTGEKVQEDLLEKFRKAAEKGGLPSGSECGNETVTMAGNTYTTSETKTSSFSSDFWNWDSDKEVTLDDYIFKKFNPHIRNYGTGFGKTMNVGAIFVTDEFTEIHFDYGLINDDTIKNSISAKYLITAYETAPIYAQLGLEYTTLKVNGFDKRMGYLNLPLTLRYVHDLNGIKIGPDFTYSFKLATNDTIKEYFGKSKYWRLGVNARWKLIQGGLFINKGDFVDYAGFRAGLAF